MYIVFNIFNQNKYLFLLKIQPFEIPIRVEIERISLKILKKLSEAKANGVHKIIIL